MNSCLEHSPFSYPQLFPTAPSHCSSRSQFWLRNIPTARRQKTAMAACLRPENLTQERNYCARRAIIITGFAIIPVLNSRAGAIEGLTAEKITDLRTQDQNKKESSSGNSFFSFVNALWVLRSGMLVALYAWTKKEMDSANATIESMKVKLNEKEAALSSLEKKFEAELMHEKEARKRALAKANKEKLDYLSVLQERTNSLYSEIDDKDDNLRCADSKSVENEKELKITRDDLEKSRNRASNLSGELQKSRNFCPELEREVSTVRTDFIEAKESLWRKNILGKEQDSENLSEESKCAEEISNKLNQDLVSDNGEVESAIFDLNEEKKMTSCPNEGLEVLETQISKDGELEIANSRISRLEDEKDAVFKALDEQKRASREAREDLEDAHNLVLRLGKERECLEKRVKKSEEELASAKGKILRLMSEIETTATGKVKMVPGRRKSRGGEKG
ncbi:MAR-binding filament-like protein [Orobanche gracilis]